MFDPSISPIVFIVWTFLVVLVTWQVSKKDDNIIEQENSMLREELNELKRVDRDWERDKC